MTVTLPAKDALILLDPAHFGGVPRSADPLPGNSWRTDACPENPPRMNTDERG
jgi:hypothetical protein